jgi:hypothetical protein
MEQLEFFRSKVVETQAVRTAEPLVSQSIHKIEVKSMEELVGPSRRFSNFYSSNWPAGTQYVA